MKNFLQMSSALICSTYVVLIVSKCVTKIFFFHFLKFAMSKKIFSTTLHILYTTSADEKKGESPQATKIQTLYIITNVSGKLAPAVEL